MTSRLVLLAALLLPRIAPACAVCFSGRDESRSAYVFTTVLLSALPLLLVGGFFWWARARSRALEREAEARSLLSRQP